jgi:hypothetical protein
MLWDIPYSTNNNVIPGISALQNLNGKVCTMVVAGKYVRIIWNPKLVTFSCIGILYGGLHE